MKKEHKKTVVKEEVVCATVYCDFCKKRLYTTVHDSRVSSDLVDYFDIVTGHNDWGNDSVDSVEHKTCCKNCLNEAFVGYLNETLKNDVRNTKYIDIVHDWTYDFGE